MSFMILGTSTVWLLVLGQLVRSNTLSTIPYLSILYALLQLAIPSVIGKEKTEYKVFKKYIFRYHARKVQTGVCPSYMSRILDYCGNSICCNIYTNNIQKQRLLQRHSVLFGNFCCSAAGSIGRRYMCGGL